MILSSSVGCMRNSASRLYAVSKGFNQLQSSLSNSSMGRYDGNPRMEGIENFVRPSRSCIFTFPMWWRCPANKTAY